MRNIYFRAIKIQKRDLLLVLLATAILLAGIVCRVGAYEQTVASVVTWQLSNKVIVLDPGHGGIDPGAVGKAGTLEKDINLQVAQKLKKMLSDAGAVVILTRESDVDLSGSKSDPIYNRKRRDLARRVEVANEKDADIFLSIHLNSYPSSRWSGAQTFYQPKQKKAKLLAESIQGEIKRQLGNTDREVLAEDLYTNRLTKMPAVTVELGFLSNWQEEKLLTQDKYQTKMAKAIFSGVAKYFAEEKNSGQEIITKKRK